MRQEADESKDKNKKSEARLGANASRDPIDLSRETISVRRDFEPQGAADPESRDYLQMLIKYASSYRREGQGEMLSLLGKSLDGLGYIVPRLWLCMLAKTARSDSLLELAENEIIFRPTKPSSLAELKSADLAKKTREHEFTLAAGDKMYSWHVPAERGRPTVLLCLGNNQRLAEAEEAMRVFTARGYGYFSFDYPGYGKSSGKPSQEGFYANALGAADFLSNELGVPDRSKIIAGNSFGTTVAVETAANLEDARGLVLLSPLCSIPDAIKDRIKNLGVSRDLFDISDRIRQRFAAIDRIGQIKRPIVILHGTDDSVVPFYHAEKLFEQAGSASARSLVSVRGAGHLDVLNRGAESILNEMGRLF